MAILCVGSINADMSYRVAHLPAAGETVLARSRMVALGGKGANQSIAAARAGAVVVQVGAVGPDGGEWITALAEAGVDVGHVARVAEPTGHAVIGVDDRGENAIIVFPGANREITPEQIRAGVAGMRAEDWLLIQNETGAEEEAARQAVEAGLKVLHAAAPFDAESLFRLLPLVRVVVVNRIEAEALARAIEDPWAINPKLELVITKGAEGAEWLFPGGEIAQPAYAVRPVDTTGAGDCFTGYLAAGLDAGLDRAEALTRAQAAAAIQITRRGAAPAMPTAAEVEAFIASRGRPA